VGLKNSFNSFWLFAHRWRFVAWGSKSTEIRGALRSCAARAQVCYVKWH